MKKPAPIQGEEPWSPSDEGETYKTHIRFKKGMIIKMNGTYLILPIAVYLLICVIWAFFRGASRSKLRLIMVFLSAVTAFVGTLLIKASATTDLVLNTIHRLASESGLDILNQLSQYSPSLEEILIKSGTAIAAPMIFFALFIALTVLTWIIYFIVTLILFPLFHRSEKKKIFRKLRASVNGLLQGIIVVIAFMIPLTCYLEMAPVIVDKAEQSGIDLPLPAEVTFEQCKSEINSLNSSLTVKAFRNYGGGWLYECLTDFSIGEGENKTNIKLADEIAPLLDFAGGVGGLSGKDITQYTETEAKLLLSLGESFSESKLLPALTSDLIYNMTEAWKNGESFATIEKPSMVEEFDPMFDDMIIIFNESSRDTAKLSEDIVTVSKLVSALSRYEIFTSMENSEALTKVLSESNVVAEISDILSENERMKIILTDLTDLSVNLLAKSLGVPEENTEIYNEMLSAIADSLTDTRDSDPGARKVIIRLVVKDELERAGIEVENDYINKLADTLIENYGDFDGEVTPAFIAEFYTVYTSMQNN